MIEAGELVVIDTGANVDGYVSDYTRTLATGELDGEMREAYDVVLAAQQAGLDAIRAGVTRRRRRTPPRATSSRAATSPARSATGSATASGSTSTRRRGSRPRAPTRSPPATSSPSSRASTSQGRFGIRIEDDVVVTEDGIENPVRFTKELVTVG